ncbi:MAG: membrane protein insertion efficiency factor YidD [Sedimentisphaerales bacterium]|nr:membrane protein insertion efficiency factor YidD [Sedimentisphaerales bacterium]
MGKLIIYLIRLYQVTLGRILGGHCKFVPSCSQYAIEAIQHFGAVKGSIMAVKRILRCHPFSQGGYDSPTDKAEKSY